MVTYSLNGVFFLCYGNVKFFKRFGYHLNLCNHVMLCGVVTKISNCEMMCLDVYMPMETSDGFTSRNDLSH